MAVVPVAHEMFVLHGRVPFRFGARQMAPRGLSRQQKGWAKGIRLTYRDRMDRLPPLAAVRAFEAAGRHENFSRAAEELGMTQAAVSYQIRQLEDRSAGRCSCASTGGCA